MNKTDNVKAARCTDALLNYETVMYFSNEDLEVRRYAEAVGDYQASFLTAAQLELTIETFPHVAIIIARGKGDIMCASEC